MVDQRPIELLATSAIKEVLLHALVVNSFLTEESERRLADDIFEEDGRALARAHALHEAVRDVLQPLRPVVAHELQDLEELRDMQVLLRADNVDHLVEVVCVVALGGPCDVAHDVDGRPVCLLDDGIAELPFA